LIQAYSHSRFSLEATPRRFGPNSFASFFSNAGSFVFGSSPSCGARSWQARQPDTRNTSRPLFASPCTGTGGIAASGARESTNAVTAATAVSFHARPEISWPCPKFDFTTGSSSGKFSRWKICGIHVVSRKAFGFVTHDAIQSGRTLARMFLSDGAGLRLVGNQSTLWQA
jgi:hypothetical protein